MKTSYCNGIRTVQCALRRITIFDKNVLIGVSIIRCLKFNILKFANYDWRSRWFMVIAKLLQ